MTSILNTIDGPDHVKALNTEAMELLAVEVRQSIIETVSRTGGHLGANLGVVELAIALVHTFAPEKDRILWDVGHQSYAYKILTGRRARFETLRQQDGISGFPRIDESPCDAFGAGHAGTALSAALGMAAARDRQGGDEHVVAIVGDGAIGCGISLEALNALHHTTERLIVILNDNEMSIAENVGSLSRHLGGMLANPRYNRWKGSVESMAGKLGLAWLRSAYFKVEEAAKSLVLGSALFEELGLRYVGPIDGHNLPALLDALSIASEAKRPILLHVATRKGKGFAPAEKEPEKWHGTGAFDIETGTPVSVKQQPAYSEVFGQTLEHLAEKNDRIVAITAAMAAGTGLSGFSRRFPRRFFDVGISEAHAAVFSAGLATRGFMPVFAVYSTFMQRAVDNVIHDVCLQNLPVVFCLDRAGIVGDDGPTHHGVFDVPLLRVVPGLILMQPADEAELAAMLKTAIELRKPAVIRYPRGTGPGVEIPESLTPLDIGKAVVTREPEETTGKPRLGPVWIWALGDMLPVAHAVAEELAEKNFATGVVNARFVRPLDTGRLKEQARNASLFLTLENGVVKGGFGSEVEEALTAVRYPGAILRRGWPDAFVPQGRSDQLFSKFGLTADVLAREVAGALSHSAKAGSVPG